ncbi:ABC transporter permease [Propionibacterium australiense]|uniref:ABC transporter permease n=1 Tax=Propionibacterium australiense TaxID=119981 RepID=A0A8B3FJP9_9ACTN|nr:ABC transporter permease [Propionibacterium australiense]RLP10239.1 ABC transporter permease [Propionibacterium australiense]
MLAGLRGGILGPVAALLCAIVLFSVATDTFLTASNVSLILAQSVVIGTLALGQTVVIITAGIDLANAAIMVLVTVVMADMAGSGHPVMALGVACLVALGLTGVSGLLVSAARLPPFIVTLGMLTIVTAAARLYTGSTSIAVSNDVMSWLGSPVQLGDFRLTHGVFVLLLSYAVMWFALTQTGWGRHVMAVGDDPEAARLVGIKTRRVLMSVYLTGGICYALAAWQALGRIPNADPSAYANGNLDSITAVVIGGTSLFGGRGGVTGTFVGTLIVIVLRNGLTQAGIDSLYQDIATGVLVIVAVLVDQMTRRGR